MLYKTDRPLKGFTTINNAKFTGVCALSVLASGSFLILLHIFLYYTVAIHTSLIHIVLQLETFFDLGPFVLYNTIA